ncbi:MAG: hypothetical protein ABEI11_01265 [Haloarculaceae archaeon]
MTDECADAAGSLDPARLRERLARFGGTPAERRAVARQARDLADAGRIERDLGAPLSVELIVSNLADAPECGPADRWNWWLGALEVAHGGYRAFGVERWPAE